MKKMLIVSHAMEIGGAERALLGLLENIDTTKVSVDLFLLRHEGEFLDMIPSNINLLQPINEYTVLARPIIQTIQEGHIIISAGRLFGKLKAKIYDTKHHLTDSAVAIEYSHKYTKMFMPPIQPNVEYDLAISFLTPHYFVAEKVKAKNKMAWIHTDYSTVSIDSISEFKMWNKYECIASISEKVTETFLSVFPQLNLKIKMIENILPKKIIEQQASASSVIEEMPNDGSFRLLSIGRFSYAKNFDNIPEICRNICNAGARIKWYIIGYGEEEKLIRQKISEVGMHEHVVILGKKENPYPYLKACDLYVQPSRYEGKAVTVREAQMMCKPVVITRYATSESQLENGVDGVIVPMDNEGCAAGIVELLRNRERMQQLSMTCAQRDYTNSVEIQKVYQLIEGLS